MNSFHWFVAQVLIAALIMPVIVHVSCGFELYQLHPLIALYTHILTLFVAAVGVMIAYCGEKSI